MKSEVKKYHINLKKFKIENEKNNFFIKICFCQKV